MDESMLFQSILFYENQMYENPTWLDLFEEIPMVMMCKYKFSIAIPVWAIHLPYILKQLAQLYKEDDVGNLGLGHYIW